MTISRPGKLTHNQTMLYEMDLLRYSAIKLATEKWANEMDKWVYLEAFLVHFRNLVEFFGRTNPRADDLSIFRPEVFWPDSASCPARSALLSLQRPDLWDKYEGAVPDRISKYLQHSTAQRVQPKNWEVGAMFSELEPLLTMLEELLPDKTRTWKTPERDPTRYLLGPESASTASASESGTIGSKL